MLMALDFVFCFIDWLAIYALYFVSGTGLVAVFINMSVENFAGWKYSLTFQIIQNSYFVGFLVYTLINLVLVFSSVYIITHFAPAAAGSGIPEIKGYLNGRLWQFVALTSVWWGHWKNELILVYFCRNWHTWYPPL